MKPDTQSILFLVRIIICVSERLDYNGLMAGNKWEGEVLLKLCTEVNYSFVTLHVSTLE